MYTIDLSGRTALVTGGASGIGRTAALTLAQAGARLAIADLDLEGALATAAGCGDGLAMRCDLGEPADIERLAAWCSVRLTGPTSCSTTPASSPTPLASAPPICRRGIDCSM